VVAQGIAQQFGPVDAQPFRPPLRLCRVDFVDSELSIVVRC
jgi:hypothetical protein